MPDISGDDSIRMLPHKVATCFIKAGFEWFKHSDIKGLKGMHWQMQKGHIVGMDHLK